MFVLRNWLPFTRGAILIFIAFVQALRTSEGFQWIEKEVNQSVVANMSVTLSWNIAFTAQEISKDHKVTFKRYPQFNSSAEVQLGLIGVDQSIGTFPIILESFAPRIFIPETTPITEPAIIIRNVTEQDEAFYRMEVNVAGTEVANHTIFLAVFVPTHNVTANCGEALRRRAMTCSCTADGDPVPTSFVWRAPNGTVLHSGSSYSTPRVEQSLNGSYYTCAASNGFSVDSRNTSLFNVLVPANVLYISPNSTYVKGSLVELVCSVEDNPPIYVAWINVTDGSVLQNKTVNSTVNTNYIIRSVSSINIGTYRCETGNKYGNDIKETTITDVFVGPTISSVAGQNESLCVGGKVVLTCEAEGNPKPYVAWIHTGNVQQNSTNTTYIISSLKRGDEGNYTCEATNVVGSTSDVTSVADVQFPAKVLFITPNRSYEVNTSVELNCSVEGDPPPYVAWINVTGSVVQNRTVNTNYIIPSVSFVNKGTYKCVTGNRCGNDSEETTIIDVLVFSCFTLQTWMLCPFISITVRLLRQFHHLEGITNPVRENL